MALDKCLHLQLLLRGLVLSLPATPSRTLRQHFRSDHYDKNTAKSRAYFVGHSRARRAPFDADLIRRPKHLYAPAEAAAQSDGDDTKPLAVAVRYVRNLTVSARDAQRTARYVGGANLSHGKCTAEGREKVRLHNPHRSGRPLSPGADQAPGPPHPRGCRTTFSQPIQTGARRAAARHCWRTCHTRRQSHLPNRLLCPSHAPRLRKRGRWSGEAGASPY